MLHHSNERRSPLSHQRIEITNSKLQCLEVFNESSAAVTLVGGPTYAEAFYFAVVLFPIQILSSQTGDRQLVKNMMIESQVSRN